MSLFSALSSTRARKTLLAAVSATVVVSGLGVPTTASAKQIFFPCCKFGPKPVPHYGYGYGAAALAGGLALGAIAASAASAADDCTIERRRVVDEDGFVTIRRVRVCY